MLCKLLFLCFGGRYLINNNEKTITKIRGDWINNDIDEQACIDFWNLFAATQQDFKIPTYENDSFLKILKKENMLKVDGSSLDIGCGTGKYSFALSESFNELVGIDISEDMLKIANDKASELEISNVNFVCSKWQNFDVKEAGYDHKFDLVFAHMTPAISCASSFEKMIEASKGYCVMSKPVGRVDSISDKIMNYLGIKNNKLSSDAQVVYALKLLKSQGYKPKIEYENQVWESQKPTELATKMYINRAKQNIHLSDEDEIELTDFIKTLEKDGQIYEETNTLITTMYWKV